MEINPQYRQWMDELPTGSDVRAVLGALVFNLKDGRTSLTRQQIRWTVFQDVMGELKNNDSLDRRIRQAIYDLRNAGVPVMSSSSGKGYWLTTQPGEIEVFIAELESRRDRMAEEIRAMRLMKDRLIRHSQSAVQERLV